MNTNLFISILEKVMAKGFTLCVNPWVYLAKYTDKKWEEKFIEKEHLTPDEEDRLSEKQSEELYIKRNSIDGLPLVNYTTQYGMGCFEGLKAFPQKDGNLKIFRPDENAKRMYNSMKGLMMPPYPEDMFVKAAVEVVSKNKKLGFVPKYNNDWEKDNFILGESVYIRPFSYSEPGIGLNLSYSPWVVIVTTCVGAYFPPGNAKAVTTDKIRATPGGTGWIKCDSNYVIPTLIKKAAIADGYMEAIFLDSVEQKYIEEGSSCNIFFYLKDGTLVTPSLTDTILPGITRRSVLTLAQDMGIKTEERKISIEEVMSEAKETFVTGTAAGISYIESITHKGKTVVFGDGKIMELTSSLLNTLKGIQYGAVEDKYGWMVNVD
jgi:branched-chain amino acid aminotransferase